MLKSINFPWGTQCIAYSFIYLHVFNVFTVVEGGYAVKKECHPDHPKIHGTTIENFELVDANSKYGVREKAFVDSKDALSDFKGSKKYCEDIGMQLADIKSLEDYKSINEYLLKKYPNCEKYQHVWVIGASQKPGDTWWWDSDTESTKFQMFLAFEPFKGKIPVDPKWDRDYMVLMCVKKDDDMQGPETGHAYRDTPHGWRYDLGVICQFHHDTECHEKSRESVKNKDIKDELWKLGETKTRKYWAGSTQKKFEDAETHCKEGGTSPMKLLDLEITEVEEAKELYKLMSEFIKKHDVLSSATSFFLSGAFTKMFQGDESIISWEWMDSRRECNVDNFYFNYFKTQHSKQGKCLSIGALYKNTEKFTISAAFCNLIHWYICFDDGTAGASAPKGRSFQRRSKRVGGSTDLKSKTFPPPVVGKRKYQSLDVLSNEASQENQAPYLATSEDEYHSPGNDIDFDADVDASKSIDSADSTDEDIPTRKPRPLKRPYQRSVSEPSGIVECRPNSTNLTSSLLQRFHANSKYLLGTTVHIAKTATFEDGKKFCEKNDLILAMIKTIHDYKAVADFLAKKDSTCGNSTQMYLVGSYKLNNASTWLDVDGSPTTFQMFDVMEPYNGNTTKTKYDRDYTVLLCEKRQPNMQGLEIGFVYRDVPHQFSFKFLVLCQFKPGNQCFEDSDETKINKEVKDEIKSLGESRGREYSIGTTQKSWNGAHTRCINESKQLLDLELSSDSEAFDLYNLLSNFITDNKLYSQAVSFITSGKFSKLFKGPSAVPFKWEWADQWRVKNDTNPFFNFVISGRNVNGKCMSVGAFYENVTQFVLYPAMCNAMHWYICYKNKYSQEPVKGRTMGGASRTRTYKGKQNMDETEENEEGSDGWRKKEHEWAEKNPTKYSDIRPPYQYDHDSSPAISMSEYISRQRKPESSGIQYPQTPEYPTDQIEEPELAEPAIPLSLYIATQTKGEPGEQENIDVAPPASLLDEQPQYLPPPSDLDTVRAPPLENQVPENSQPQFPKKLFNISPSEHVDVSYPSLDHNYQGNNYDDNYDDWSYEDDYRNSYERYDDDWSYEDSWSSSNEDDWYDYDDSYEEEDYSYSHEYDRIEYSHQKNIPNYNSHTHQNDVPALKTENNLQYDSPPEQTNPVMLQMSPELNHDIDHDTSVLTSGPQPANITNNESQSIISNTPQRIENGSP